MSRSDIQDPDAEFQVLTIRQYEKMLFSMKKREDTFSQLEHVVLFKPPFPLAQTPLSSFLPPSLTCKLESVYSLKAGALESARFRSNASAIESARRKTCRRTQTKKPARLTHMYVLRSQRSGHQLQEIGRISYDYKRYRLNQFHKTE